MKRLSNYLWAIIAVFTYSHAWSQPSFPENGLVSYFPLNSNTNDYTGYFNEFTGGLFFDDRNNNSASALSNLVLRFIEFPAYQDLKVGDNNTDFTVAAWVNLEGSYSNGTFPTAVAIGNGVVLGFQTITPTQLRVRAVVQTATSPFFYQLQSINVNPQTVSWIHLAIVKIGSQYTLYANEPGVANAIDLQATAGSSNATLTYGNPVDGFNFSIGTYGQNASESFTRLNGRVDDVFIYNRGMLSNEIFDLYSASNLNVVGTPPKVTASSNAICEGESLTLSIPVNNSATAYQWQKDGINISNDANYSGANTNELTLSNATATLSGEYRCLASVPGANVYSESISIQVFESISSNINDFLENYFPLNNSYEDAVGTKTLTPSGIGFAEDRYSADSAAATTIASDGKITIDQPFGLETGSISMWFYRPPTTQAQNKIILTSENQPLFFTGIDDQFVYVNGFGFIEPDGGKVLIEEGWHHIVITKSNNFMDVFIDNVKVVDNDPNAFSLVQEPIKFIGGDNNPANSNVGQRFDEVRFYNSRLNEQQVALLYNAPIISEYPKEDVNACTGETISLSVEAGGATGFQWTKNGIPINDGDGISGANTNNLTISNFATANGGTYKVVISNNCFDNESFNTQITALPSSTSISTQPQDASVCEGESATFIIETSGETPLSYQWFLNGQNLTDNATFSGTNTNTLIISDAASVTGTYSVSIETDCGIIESNDANLSLNTNQNTPDKPVISVKTGEEGISDILILTANSIADTYQWYVNGEAIAGATGQDYEVQPSDFSNNAPSSFTVEVSFTAGCSIVSDVFVLTSDADEIFEAGLSVFPNPAKDSFIVSNGLFKNKQLDWHLYNSEGKELSKVVYQINETQFQVLTSNLPSGLYLLLIESDDAKAVLKIQID